MDTDDFWKLHLMVLILWNNLFLTPLGKHPTEKEKVLIRVHCISKSVLHNMTENLYEISIHFPHKTQSSIAGIGGW